MTSVAKLYHPLEPTADVDHPKFHALFKMSGTVSDPVASTGRYSNPWVPCSSSVSRLGTAAVNTVIQLVAARFTSAKARIDDLGLIGFVVRPWEAAPGCGRERIR